MAIITDGTGTGGAAKVNGDNRLYVDAITTTIQADANEKGNAYNLNTGVINLSSGSETAVMYLKNTDPTKLLHITAFAVGLGPSTGGVSTEIPKITIIRNPTAGSILSTPTNIDINSNRNYGSSNTLTVDAYKGEERCWRAFVRNY
jgi:hypothetical protein